MDEFFFLFFPFPGQRHETHAPAEARASHRIDWSILFFFIEIIFVDDRLAKREREREGYH